MTSVQNPLWRHFMGVSTLFLLSFYMYTFSYHHNLFSISSKLSENYLFSSASRDSPSQVCTYTFEKLMFLYVSLLRFGHTLGKIFSRQTYIYIGGNSILFLVSKILLQSDYIVSVFATSGIRGRCVKKFITLDRIEIIFSNNFRNLSCIAYILKRFNNNLVRNFLAVVHRTETNMENFYRVCCVLEIRRKIRVVRKLTAITTYVSSWPFARCVKAFVHSRYNLILDIWWEIRGGKGTYKMCTDPPPVYNDRTTFNTNEMQSSSASISWED